MHVDLSVEGCLGQGVTRRAGALASNSLTPQTRGVTVNPRHEGKEGDNKTGESQMCLMSG